MINWTVVILHKLGYIISVYLTPITNALITLDFCLIDNFEKKTCASYIHVREAFDRGQKPCKLLLGRHW